MDARSNRELAAALAAASGLRLSEEELARLMPWFEDIRAGLALLHEAAASLPDQLEPAIARPDWADVSETEASGVGDG